MEEINREKFIEFLNIIREKAHTVQINPWWISFLVNEFYRTYEKRISPVLLRRSIYRLKAHLPGDWTDLDRMIAKLIFEFV